VLISDMSGRTNILMKATELGFDLKPDAPETRTITATVKELEAQGFESEAAEASLALLIRGVLDHNPELLFTVDSYHVSMRSNGQSSVCEATVKIRVGEKVHHTVAEGDGPVNALDGEVASGVPTCRNGCGPSVMRNVESAGSIGKLSPGSSRGPSRSCATSRTTASTLRNRYTPSRSGPAGSCQPLPNPRVASTTAISMSRPIA